MTSKRWPGVGAALVYCPLCGESVTMRVVVRHVIPPTPASGWLNVEFETAKPEHKCKTNPTGDR